MYSLGVSIFEEKDAFTKTGRGARRIEQEIFAGRRQAAMPISSSPFWRGHTVVEAELSRWRLQHPKLRVAHARDECGRTWNQEDRPK